MPDRLSLERQMVSQSGQSLIERPDVPRSKFSGTFTTKKTFDAGYLIPFLLDEILPGDHMQYDVTAYLRMATPLFPIFDNQKIDTFFFFVPNRLVWEHWVRFMGEQTDGPSDSIAYTVPTISSPASGFAANSIYDHFGIPVVGQIAGGGVSVINALPLRAYHLIYREWFRDENLQNSPGVPINDGPDNPAIYATLRRGKMHDYFTSCLPWPQKFTAPTVPIGTFAPVVGLGYDRIAAGPAGPPVNVWEVNVANFAGSNPKTYNTSWPIATAGGLYIDGTGTGLGSPRVYADLSQSTGLASVNVLRQAWLVQMLLERDARGGTRYTEIVKNHFGVSSPDMRLQRPEYIGGGSTPFMITPIAQTAPSAGVPVGALGAAGTAVGQHRASYAATEHGFIIGLINVRTELSYQQGLHKMWSRQTRYDYYWPALAGLGEQAVLTREIYHDGGAGDPVVFGYQERWQEYRTRYSDVTGLFRSTTAGTLDAWHLSQRFAAPGPVLNTTFIMDTPPMSRVLAAGALADNQQYLADIMIRREAVRPIPMFGTPVGLGRF